MVRESQMRRRSNLEPIGPCVRCHDPGGKAHSQGTRPLRADGARFGIDGKVCKACIDALYTARRRARPLPPCAACGTSGGWSRSGREGRPVRYEGIRYGIDGPICHECATARAGCRTSDSGPKSVEEVRFAALAILAGYAAVCEAAEAKRRERAARARPPLSPLEASLWARKVFRQTSFAYLLGRATP